MASPRHLSHRPTYTPAQLTQYFAHISLPPSFSASSAPTLPLLSALLTHHLLGVSFDNVSIHYSPPPHRAPSLDAEDLFTKTVTRGHGGYCMESNSFFGNVLRSLGYDVLSVGGRVSDLAMGPREKEKEVGYTGWSHMVNLVTIDGTRYVVDVGFGGNNPIHPLPLVEGLVTPGIAPAVNRLVRASIPTHTDKGQRVWVFQHKDDEAVADEDEWLSMYCFTETEFLPMDYEVMNYFTATSPMSFFSRLLLSVKMLEGGEGKGTGVEGVKLPGGVVMMVGNEVTRRVGGKKETLKMCETEGERVEALEKWFGIKLNEEERRGIKGSPLELKHG